MTPNILSPANFPFAFSELVSNAAMTLPPLTRSQDSAFLRKMTEVVMDIFWQNYVATLPEGARKAFENVSKAEDGVPLYEWFRTYANFEGDSLAEVRGRNIFLELQEKLPGVLLKEYDLFTEDDAEAE